MSDNFCGILIPMSFSIKVLKMKFGIENDLGRKIHAQLLRLSTESGDGVNNSDFDKYLAAFCSLRSNTKDGRGSPHKPLMLLSVLSMADNGLFPENKIYFAPEVIQDSIPGSAYKQVFLR